MWPYGKKTWTKWKPIIKKKSRNPKSNCPKRNKNIPKPFQ